MTIAHRGLKVKVMGQVSAVGPTSIKGSFLARQMFALNCFMCWKGFSLSSEQLVTRESFVHDGIPYTLKHGDVILAAITGCTNATSSSVMLAAGKCTVFTRHRLRGIGVAWSVTLCVSLSLCLVVTSHDH